MPRPHDRRSVPTPAPASAAAGGPRPTQVAEQLAFASQSVRNAILALHAEGLDFLGEKSRRPKSVRPELDDAARELRHRGPRDFGKSTSMWTLDLGAEVACAEGITPRVMSGETIRQGLKRLVVG